MNIRNYIKFLLPEEIYAIITIIYLIRLNKLNKQLLSVKFGNSLELLAYDDSKPIRYFVIALILFVVGGIIIYFRIKKIQSENLCFRDMALSLVSIVIIIVFLMLLFVLINNPILRAILVVVAGGIAAICAAAK